MPMHALVFLGVVIIAAAAAWYPVPFCVQIAFGERCSVRWAVRIHKQRRVLLSSTFGRKEGAGFLCQLAMGGAPGRIPTVVRLCRSVSSCALKARVSFRGAVGTGDAALTAILAGLGWVGSGLIAASCPEVTFADFDVRGDFARPGINTALELTGRVRIGEVLIKHITS